MNSPAVTAVIDRLREAGRVQDPIARRRLADGEARGRLSADERAEMCRAAPLAVSDETARLLYLLAAGTSGGRVVEFGCSLGLSTLYLAAALRDRGGGSLTTTELDGEKAVAARRNLLDAGLADLVEVRTGDALETLTDLEGPVDLLMLDGWNELYIPVLQLVGPLVSAGGLVVADMSREDPCSIAYLEHVSNPANGFFSVELPIDAGVVLSRRVA